MKIPLALATFVFAALPVAGFAADPYAGYIYPCGIQAGTTNRFLVGGQHLRRLKGIRFGGEGLRLLDIKNVPAFPIPARMQKIHLKKWLDGIANGNRQEPSMPDDPHISEWRSNSWWRVLGSLDAFELSLVERDLFTPRVAFQDAPSLRQLCIVTVAADASAKPGIYSVSLWGEGGISAPRLFAVTAAARMAEPLYSPPHRASPRAAVADAQKECVVLDGQIMPGETDAFRVHLRGGLRYGIAVTARELQPYVGDAVPGFFNPAVTVRDSKGRVAVKADDTLRFRPDPSFVFTPEESGEYVIEIHDVLYRGRADFVYAIAVSPHGEECPASSFSHDRSGMLGLEGDLRFQGIVADPGGKCSREFDVDVPGMRVLEVFTRRNGSPLDAVLEVRSIAGGPSLLRWDDVTNRVFVGTVPQSECDPCGRFFFEEPGRYIAEISDRTGHGGAEYGWELEIRSSRPDFVVYSSRSTLPLLRGAPLKVDFIVDRKDGFDGSVTVEFPRNVRAKGNVAAPGVDRITVELTYSARSPFEIGCVDVWARGTVAGRTVRRKVVPCDEYEQAFAWRHLVPANSFLMRAVPGGKFSAKPPSRRSKVSRD